MPGCRGSSARGIVLIPIAIAINIAARLHRPDHPQASHLPRFDRDDPGGRPAGPIAGALTGILSNLIWQYAPGIGGGTIGPFAITAA